MRRSIAQVARLTITDHRSLNTPVLHYLVLLMRLAQS